MKNLNENWKLIINKLETKGYEAYLVGGAVRDIIMNKTPSDVDITTNATPVEMKEVFSEYTTIDTGIKHGTVTVIFDGTPFEITTYRTESGYSDGRHPDLVSFTKDIKDDLSRRDFTMNSIAFSPDSGFVDPYGGKYDIKNKTIRCVGKPTERFTEDSLRILRALRFSSVLGFQIEDETEKAMFDCCELLSNISTERVFTELTKLLCGKNVKQVLMKYSDIIAVIIPEIKAMKGFNQHNFHHKYDLLGHTATVTQNISPKVHLRLAAFLHDIAKPLCMSFDDNGVGHFYGHPSLGAKIADDILRRLKSDNRTRESVVTLIKLHDNPIEESERIIKRKLRTIGKDMLFDLIELQCADTSGLADEYHTRYTHFDRLAALTENILRKEECFSLKNLDINGNDVTELGYQGRKVGKILNTLLDAVIDGKAENSKEQLIEYIKRNGL